MHSKDEQLIGRWLHEKASHNLYFPASFKLPPENNKLTAKSVLFKKFSFALPDANKMYQLQVFCTLYHKDYGFIGRTYAAPPIQLNSPYAENIETVSFYTNISLDSMELVIEFAVSETIKDSPLGTKTQSIGWTKLEFAEGAHTIQIHDGSPKMLLQGKISAYIKDFTLEYVVENGEVGMLYKTVPSNCLFGSAEKAPFSKSFTIYINYCKLHLPETMESLLLKQVMRKEAGTAKIYERRLRVGCHNQWKFINSAGLQNSISLSLSNDVLSCNGILLVNNVIADERVALIFQLEYILRITKVNGENENKRLVLGEFVVLVKSDDGQIVEMEVEQDMPKKIIWGVAGDMLWPGYKMLQGSVRLQCKISPEPGLEQQPPENDTKKSLISEEKKKLEELLSARSKEINEIQSKREAEIMEKQKTLELREKELTELLSQSAPEEPLENSKPIKVPELIKPIVIKEETPEILQEEENNQPKPEFAQSAIDIVSEKSDSLKANTIFIEFAALRVFQEFPRKLAFSLKFYSFPSSNTPSVSLWTKKADADGFMPLLLRGPIANWTNVASRDESLKLQYDFDPSLSPEIPLEYQMEDFIKYMALQSVTVNVWDADSMIMLGFFNIPLSECMRRGRSVIEFSDVYSVIGQDRTNIIGEIKLNIKNVGREVGIVKKINGKKTTRIGKTKLVSKPIAKDAKLKEAKSETVDEKTQLVLSYRLNYELVGTKQSEWEIEKYRSVSRTMALQEVIEKQPNDIPTTPYILGQLLLLPIFLENKESQSEVYKIEIEDTENNGDVKLVTDPNEWEFYCRKDGHALVNDWKRFQNANELILNSKEQIVAIIKVLAFNKPKNLRRKISVRTVRVTNSSTVFSKSTYLSYHDTFYNASYSVTVVENSPFTFTCPEPAPEVIRFVKSVSCSNPTMNIVIAGDHLEISGPAFESPFDKEFLVFCFSEEYCYNTICIISCTVRAYMKIPIKVIAGETSTSDINIKGSKFLRIVERSVSPTRLYSSHKCVNLPLELPENGSLPVVIRAFEPGNHNVYVHAISLEEKEVIQRWELTLDVLPPKVTKKVKGKLEVGTSFVVEHENASTNKNTYEIATSSPQLIQVLQPIITIPPLKKIEVPFIIKASEQPLSAPIVYIYQKDSLKPEAVIELIF